MRLRRQDLVGGTVVALLTVTYAGREFRWATKVCETVDTAGSRRVFDGQLADPDLAEEADVSGGTPDTIELTFEVYFPADVTVAELVALGHDLGAAHGELALWVDGTNHEQRVVVLSGLLREVEYGDVDEPVVFTLRAHATDAGTLYPPGGARVTASTWPTAPTESLGLYYPIPLGYPGQYQRNPSQTTSGSPALIVEMSGSNASTLLIGFGELHASTVLIFDETTSEVFATKLQRDGRDQLCTVVDITGAGTISRTASEYWVGFRRSGGGGILNRRRDGPVRTVGQLCETVLGWGADPVDQGAWRAARPVLDQWEVAGFIAEAVNPMQWLAQNVLDDWLFQVVHGAGGMAPRLIPLTPTAEDVVADLEEGPGVDIVGRVRYGDEGEVANEIRMEYALRAKTGAPRLLTTVGGTEADDVDEAVSHHLATISVARYGPRAEERKFPLVYSARTALQLGRRRLEALALRPRYLEAHLGIEWLWLQVGDVVRLTSTRLHLTRQVAVVLGRQPVSLTKVVLTLCIREVPARDRRKE